MTTLLIIALILFALGSLPDILSSLGQVELNPLWDKRDGLFNLRTNLIGTACLLAVGAAIGKFTQVDYGAYFLGIIGLVRSALAVHNWRLKGRRQV